MLKFTDLFQFLGKWYIPIWYPPNDFEASEHRADYSVIMWRSKGNLMHSAYGRSNK